MDRQRYLAELSKLLTFMFKEDRSEILQHYNELLDNAEDEQALLQEFGSPTKLAVTISRSYDREERKLSVDVDSKTKEEPVEYTKPDETEFKVITPVSPVQQEESISEDDMENEDREPDEDDLDYSESFVETSDQPSCSNAEASDEKFVPIFFESPEPEETTEENIESEKSSEGSSPVEDASAEELPQSEESAHEDVSEESDELSPEAAEESPEETLAEVADESPEDASDEAAERIEEPEVSACSDVTKPVPEVNEPENFPDYSTDFIKETEGASAAEGRLSPVLLVLYLILAIPLGLVLLILLTALILGMLGSAAAIISCSVLAVSFSLAGISVAADIMLIIGGAVIAFALGILLLWTAIWLIITGYKALINGIIKLGRKFCVRGAEW